MNNVPASKIVNMVAKYLYKNLDGAFKLNTSSNSSDVYVTLLYQIPRLQRIPGRGKEYNDVHEMTLNLSITTYQNKIRVNVIEITPEERTLGCDVYHPDVLKNLPDAKDLIFYQVVKRVRKAYNDYDFIF